MTTNIYILKGSQQHGPYRPEDLKTFLQNGQMAPTLLSRFDGGADWVPVFCIPEIQADPSLSPLLRSASSCDQSVELAVVESTLNPIVAKVDPRNGAQAASSRAAL